MTDTSNRSRVTRGVPQGGEFATEARDENPDLGVTVFYDGNPTDEMAVDRFAPGNWTVGAPGKIPLVVETLYGAGLPDDFGEANTEVLRQIRHAGITGKLTVYDTDKLGRWRAAAELPEGGHLIFEAGHPAAPNFVSVLTQNHAGDDASEARVLVTHADSVRDKVDIALFRDGVATRFREAFPFTGANVWSSKADNNMMLSLGGNEGVVTLEYHHDENEPEYSDWRVATRAGEDSSETWNIAARYCHNTDQYAVHTQMQMLTRAAMVSRNRRWAVDGRFN